MSNFISNDTSLKKKNKKKKLLKIFSVSQKVAHIQRKKMRIKKKKIEEQTKKKKNRSIFPPDSFLLILKKKLNKTKYYLKMKNLKDFGFLQYNKKNKRINDYKIIFKYNRKIIDYKNCGFLRNYIGRGGKILSKLQTGLIAKQQRYVAKTIKSARIMGLLTFVKKEKGYFN